MPDTATPPPIGPAELADRLQQVLHQLWMRHRYCEAAHAASGMLTTQQLDLLSILIAQGPTRASDLAELTGVAASSITIGAQRLTRDGLITRSSRSPDLREVYIDITEHGHHRYQISQAARTNRARAAFARLSPREREALRRALPILQEIPKRLSGSYEVSEIATLPTSSGAGTQ